MALPRAYKRGRGHAPRVHDMARQNSNQPAGYAKFILRALRTLSNVAVPYQFYHTFASIVYTGRARAVWQLLLIL